MKDFGYDVADYCDVDPMFGTLADFDALVERAHELGLRVMIDQVLSHTSDQHAWFIESRASRDNPKADWYVWADAKEDGTPPNNWLSVFGGSAWQWDTRRCQYYLHNFLVSQPDLNFHNPEVQDALLGTREVLARDRGVDGYRLDTANFYFHDAQLRDNPPRGRPAGETAGDQRRPIRTAGRWHQYDKSQPENLVLPAQAARPARPVPAHHDGRRNRRRRRSGARRRVHRRRRQAAHGATASTCFRRDHSAPYLHDLLSRFEDIAAGGWPCWALSNQDVVRVATRWGGSEPLAATVAPGGGAADEHARHAVPLSGRRTRLAGSGDRLRRFAGPVRHHHVAGIQGARRLPHADAVGVKRKADLGFSSAAQPARAPWLPIAETHRPLAIDVQEDEPDSLLHFYRHLLQWRKRQAALIGGTMTMLAVDPQVLALCTRRAPSSACCMCSTSASSRDLDHSGRTGGVRRQRTDEWELAGSGLAGARIGRHAGSAGAVERRVRHAGLTRLNRPLFAGVK